uniref:NADH-ubiquinone oxidoreductase chain 4L n=1 Tax=Lopheros rubens TaxID=1588210 RepID=A0A343C4V5_9COLE|nr:NADH dehydrogenase subunit 4L [Lopheros rubens]
MTLSFNFSLFIFIVGLISFSYKCKHLLLMLLSLEYVVLSVYLMMFYMFYSFSMDYYFCLIFISMMVCESALGLSILVVMVRCYGNDYFQSLSILW